MQEKKAKWISKEDRAFYGFEKPSTVIAKIKEIFSYSYPKKEFSEVEEVYHDVVKLFRGKFKGYRACNLAYHDFSHTTSVFVALCRLIDRYNLQHALLPVEDVKNALNAALFHDSGYIQKIGDTKGTGAKYTLTCGT